MLRARYLLALLMVLIIAGLAVAAEQPLYDEKADAHQQVSAALAKAARAGKNIILIFGANWCPDCHALDAQMHKGDLAALIAEDFVIVNVDVGRHDKNLDLAEKYKIPIEHGIPALAVLDQHGKILHAMDQGQFADARHMSYESIRAFFVKWQRR